MNKHDLMKSVKEKFGMTHKAAHDVVEHVLGEVKTSLQTTGKVRLDGFGNMQVVMRAERTRRNPRTGEPVRVPAKRTVKFKPSKQLLIG